ncbi:hypothetical protein [Nocardia sp. NPDC005825]|uniref:hypothetical protein n=1 Tax=unclassified Nocardia TaxID=2637762 RepID=UPI0033E90BF8
MSTTTRGRLIGGGVASALAIAGVFGAGIAAADTAPTSITVAGGTNLIVNHTYTITVHCQVQGTLAVAIDLDPYSATDASQLLGGDNIAAGSNLLATVQWTPTTLGSHTIEAYGCASGAGWPGSRPPTATLAVNVTAEPTSTGSADSLPVVGNVLKALGL